MTRCHLCGKRIIRGGKQTGTLVFCSDGCRRRSALLEVARQIPDDAVRQRVLEIHQGACPVCGGRGPVDLHTSYLVWSALLFTSSRSRSRISCKACGDRRKWGDAALSMVFGWWGLPFGLVMTPVQIARNLGSLSNKSQFGRPSLQLQWFVRTRFATRAMSQPGKSPEQRLTGRFPEH